jgi:hypothetical protein
MAIDSGLDTWRSSIKWVESLQELLAGLWLQKLQPSEDRVALLDQRSPRMLSFGLLSGVSADVGRIVTGLVSDLVSVWQTVRILCPGDKSKLSPMNPTVKSWNLTQHP